MEPPCSKAVYLQASGAGGESNREGRQFRVLSLKCPEASAWLRFESRPEKALVVVSSRVIVWEPCLLMHLLCANALS